MGRFLQQHEITDMSRNTEIASEETGVELLVVLELRVDRLRLIGPVIYPRRLRSVCGVADDACDRAVTTCARF